MIEKILNGLRMAVLMAVLATIVSLLGGGCSAGYRSPMEVEFGKCADKHGDATTECQDCFLKAIDKSIEDLELLINRTYNK